MCNVYVVQLTVYKKRKSCENSLTNQTKPNDSICKCPNKQQQKKENRKKLRMKTHKTINCAIVIVQTVKSMTPFLMNRPLPRIWSTLTRGFSVFVVSRFSSFHILLIYLHLIVPNCSFNMRLFTKVLVKFLRIN